MTALNNNFFTPQCIKDTIRYQFYISNQPNSDTNTMQESEVIALFSNSQYTIKIILKEFIAGYNTINNRYYYKINLCAKVINNKASSTPKEEYTELYNDSFTIHDDIMWLLHSINNTISSGLSKISVIEPDNISLVCFLVDYLITLSLVQFPRTVEHNI
jgi:hypothetical protein